MIFDDVNHRRRNDALDVVMAVEQTNYSFNKACFVKMFNELLRLFLSILREAEFSSLFTTSQTRSSGVRNDGKAFGGHTDVDTP